jgi:hypothetical protein
MATAGVKLCILSEKHRFRAAAEYMHINYHRSLVAFIFGFHPILSPVSISVSFFIKIKCLPNLRTVANTAAREVEPLGVDTYERRRVLPAMTPGRQACK